MTPNYTVTGSVRCADIDVAACTHSIVKTISSRSKCDTCTSTRLHHATKNGALHKCLNSHRNQQFFWQAHTQRQTNSTGRSNANKDDKVAKQANSPPKIRRCLLNSRYIGTHATVLSCRVNFKVDCRQVIHSAHMQMRY